MKRDQHKFGYGPRPLPERYVDKVFAARSMLITQPDIESEPEYFVVVGATVDNVGVVVLDSAPTILFSEKVVREYGVEELAGIMAHELAHAEWLYKHADDNRAHYLVDLRAVQLVGKELVLEALTRLQKETRTHFRKNVIWYCIYCFEFCSEIEKHRAEMREIESRIEKVRNYQPQ